MFKLLLITVSMLLASDSLLTPPIIVVPIKPYTHDFNLSYKGSDTITISWVSPLNWGLNGGLFLNLCSTITDSFTVFLKRENGDSILLIRSMDTSVKTITVLRTEIQPVNGDSIIGFSYNHSLECTVHTIDGQELHFDAQQFQRIANPEEVLIEVVNTEIMKTNNGLTCPVKTIISTNLLTIITNDIPIKEIRVISLTGQAIKIKKNISGTKIDISTSSIPNGLYIVETKTLNGTFYSVSSSR